MPTRPVEPIPNVAASALHNLSDCVRRWANADPTRPAWADDRDRIDFGQAESRIQHLAGWLVRQGIRRGDRVALWLGNRVHTLEALFAAMRIGAIAIPLNARLTPAEIGFQLADSRAALLFVEPEWRDAADTACRAAINASASRTVSAPVVQVVDADFAQHVLAGETLETCAAVVPDDPALMMYTSGTTGQPKGALLPHRKGVYNARNAEIYFGIRRGDRVLVVAPLFHSLGLQILALPAIYAGASVHLQEGFDAERVWRTIRDEGIDYFGGVPTMFQRLIDALDAGRPFEKPPEKLRFAFTAGAAAPRDLFERFHDCGLALIQGYGQTETSTLSCVLPEHVLSKAGSVGRPVRHAELRVVRTDGIDGPVDLWQDAAIGEVGEIVVRGPITMLGYWERPEETARTLREGWLRTGDLATRDADFDLTLAGRVRELFISGGENVYPAEIEAVLEAHPGIEEAAVVGIEDEAWGEVGRAYVVKKAGAPVAESDLVAWLDARLARFKQPREIVFEPSLPRTASGKVQKHRLRGDADRV